MFDFSTWFATSNANCPVTTLQFFFTTSNTSPVSEQIAEVEFVPSTTNFTVNFPNLFINNTFAVNTEKVFYLVAKSAPVIQQTILEVRFKKTHRTCWSSSLD